MTDILDLAGRVAFVTGAGQGVGRQIALHLASHNSNGVAVNDFFLDRAEAVAEEIREAGGKADRDADQEGEQPDAGRRHRARA